MLYPTWRAAETRDKTEKKAKRLSIRANAIEIVTKAETATGSERKTDLEFSMQLLHSLAHMLFKSEGLWGAAHAAGGGRQLQCKKANQRELAAQATFKHLTRTTRTTWTTRGLKLGGD